MKCEKCGQKIKIEWVKIPEKNIEITKEQQYNGLTYLEILKKVKESEIADYNLLRELRNKGYEFLKSFWVFVPNPDKISKEKGDVASFFVDSWADLLCFRSPSDSDGSLGVFLVRSLK